VKGKSSLTSFPVRRGRIHIDLPGVLVYAIRDGRLDAAQHAERRVGGVGNGKGDGRVRDVCHVPGSIRPIIGSAMQRIIAVVELRRVRDIVKGVVTVANAIDVASWDGVVHGVPRILCCFCVPLASKLSEKIVHGCAQLTIVIQDIVAQDHVNVVT
jgi:hypothetical protein